MRKKSIKKQFWIDNKEDNLLKEKANKAGLSEAEFLRTCIIGYKIKEQPTKEIKEFQREISGIANNINQIARAANTMRYVSTENIGYIQKNVMDFIMRFEKKIYSRGDD